MRMRHDFGFREAAHLVADVLVGLLEPRIAEIGGSGASARA